MRKPRSLGPFKRVRVLLATAACLLPLILLLSASRNQQAAAALQSGGWPRDINAFQACTTNAPLLGVKNDASGLTHDPSSNTWWLVADQPLAALQYSADFSKLLLTVPLPGVLDPEAIAWISPGRLAIAEEMRDPAVVVTVAPAEGGAVGAAAAAAVAVGAIALGSPLGVATLVSRVSVAPPIPRVENAGFEGLAFSPSEGAYYLAQQKEPQAVYRLLPDGTHTLLFDGSTLGVKELSEVTCYGGPSCPTLLLMSQADKEMLHVSKSGEVLSRMKIKGLKRPEGLAVSADGLSMAVASEPSTYSLYSVDPCA